MGLDIYLYRYDDHANAKAVEAERERRTDALWDAKPYDKMSEAEREAIRAQTAAIETELGYERRPFCDGSDIMHEYLPGESKIDRKHPKYPEHVCRIGYFRSSYNDGGIERVAELAIGLRPLDFIFAAGEECEFSPDWNACKARCVEVRAKWAEYRASPRAKYSVLESRHNMFKSLDAAPANKSAALDMLLAELKRERSPNMSSYGTADGEFFMAEPLRVCAIIPGRQQSIMGKLHGRAVDEPVTFIVYEQSEGEDWYGQALEIVEDTIDLVLADKDPHKFWLHWSG